MASHGARSDDRALQYNPRMQPRFLFVTLAFSISLAVAAGHAQKRHHLNPVISLLEQNKPVFGVYWPSNGGGRGGGPSTGSGQAASRPAGDLARDALAYQSADFLFSGSMEGGVDRGLPAYTEFLKALTDAAGATKAPFFGLTRGIVVKTPKIATDPAKVVDNISRQLNVG